MNIKTLRDRKDLGHWLNQNNLHGEGVEVGSLCGEFAREIISSWHGKMLYMVDPWEKQDPSVYREPVNDGDWSAAYASCKILRDQHPHRITLLRGYSPAMSAAFTDGSLDFVYIDANHSLESIRADIRAWWGKVRSGGLFGGHDFWEDTIWPNHCQVRTGVTEWSEAINRPIHYTQPCGSWWFIKP
jgi:hypothetical protein